jgi:UDP-glucose 4-epimerase
MDKVIDLDVTSFEQTSYVIEQTKPCGIFHLAAVSRTPTAIADPVGCAQTNIMGTINVLEAARKAKTKRVILASSNVVYAAETPYKASKLCGEMWGTVYHELYGLSVLSLRFSNVYGPGMKDDDIAVFASLRRSKKQKGYLQITGNGEQTRDYTHVSDIVEGLIAAMHSDYCGEPIDLCTGKNTSLNKVAKFFACPIEYIPERLGDVKHIVQSPERAKECLGWRARVSLADGIKDVL